jgi:hypothetical protein
MNNYLDKNFYEYKCTWTISGPDQQELISQGNSYIHQIFPKTDFLKTCKVMEKNPETGEYIRDLKSVEVEF